MKTLQKVTDVVLALILMLCIISAAVILTLNFRQLYYYDVKALEISKNSGYSEEDIIKNYDALIDYNSMFDKSELSLPTLPMSEHGKIHFEEVKVIFVAFEYFFCAALIFGAAGLIYKLIKKRYSVLTLTGALSIIIPLFVGGFIALNWERCFVLFHEIMFDNDYWLFDPVTDPVIRILPDEFFMHCAVMIVALVILCSIICILLGTLLSKKQRKKK